MQQWEKEFRESARRYMQKGQAIVELLPVQKEMDAHGNLRFVKISPFDAYGVRSSDGKFLGGELKQTAAPRLPFCSESGLKQHQWLALQDFDKCHALVFLWWKHDDRVVRLSVPMIRAIRAFEPGRKSLSWDCAVTVGYTILRGDGMWHIFNGLV